MYISRALESVVLRYSSSFPVVVLTGPRQVGKTTMLRHLAQKEREHGRDRSYVSLDDTSQLQLAREDPALFLQRYRPPVLIDEIQRAPELLPYIKLKTDETGDKGAFWLTGSQPFHLMKNVSESLVGRAGILELQGLSDAELEGMESVPFNPSSQYFEQRVSQMPQRNVSQVFTRIVKGSFPGIVTAPDDVRSGAFESLIDMYLMRDIRDLAQVGDETKFRRFMIACAVLTSKPVVYAELARIADVDEKTAKTWLSLLESSYIVKIVRPFSNNLLKRLNKQPVMHFLDTGLCAHLAGWENPTALEMSEMSGRVFESFVFSEIYKSFINSGDKAPLYFFRNNDKKEIDLLMEREHIVYPIEVKKTASPKKDDTKNFSAISPLAESIVSEELMGFKRDIGLGCVICMTQDTYPIKQDAWAFPAWAI